MSIPQIDKGVPIPPTKTRRGTKYACYRRSPIRQLEIGDSFFWPSAEPVADSRNFLTSAKTGGFKITTRRVEGGIRVWRIS